MSQNTINNGTNISYQSPNLTVTNISNGQTLTTTYTISGGSSITVPYYGNTTSGTAGTTYIPMPNTGTNWNNFGNIFVTPNTSYKWIPSPMDVKSFLDDVRARKDKLSTEEVAMIKDLLAQIKRLYMEII